MGNTTFCTLPDITEFIRAKADSQQIETADYQIMQELNDSRFGPIIVMRSKSKDHLLYVKERELDYSNSEFDEIKFRSQLSNPYLLEIYGFKRANAENRVQIYFETFESDLEKDIHKAITDKIIFSEEKLNIMLFCILSALSYLQENCVSYENITPVSILRIGLTYKLYENSIIANSPTLYEQALKGHNLRYLAPELLAHVARNDAIAPKHNSFKSDVYSLGICLLDAGVLSSGETTLVDRKKLQIIEENHQDRIKRFKELYSSQLSSIIEEMVSLDPKKRPDALTLYNRLPHKIRDGKRRIFAPIMDSPRHNDHPLIVQSKIIGSPKYTDFDFTEESKFASSNKKPRNVNRSEPLKQNSSPIGQNQIIAKNQDLKSENKVSGTVKVEKSVNPEVKPFETKFSYSEFNSSYPEAKNSDFESKALNPEIKSSYSHIQWSSLEPKSLYNPMNSSQKETKPDHSGLKLSHEETKYSDPEHKSGNYRLKFSQNEVKTNPSDLKSSNSEVKPSLQQSEIHARNDQIHRSIQREDFNVQKQKDELDRDDIKNMKISESIINDPILFKFVKKMYDHQILVKHQNNTHFDHNPLNTDTTIKFYAKPSLAEYKINIKEIDNVAHQSVPDRDFSLSQSTSTILPYRFPEKNDLDSHKTQRFTQDLHHLDLNQSGSRFSAINQIEYQFERYSKPTDLPPSHKPYNYFSNSSHEQGYLHPYSPVSYDNRSDIKFSSQLQLSHHSPIHANPVGGLQSNLQSQMFSPSRNISDSGNIDDRINAALLKTRENIAKTKYSSPSTTVDFSHDFNYKQLPHHQSSSYSPKNSQIIQERPIVYLSTENNKNSLKDNTVTPFEGGDHSHSKKNQYENLSNQELTKLVAEIKKEFQPKIAEAEKLKPVSTMQSEQKIYTDANKIESNSMFPVGVSKIDESLSGKYYPAESSTPSFNNKSFDTQFDELKKDIQGYFNKEISLKSN